MSSVRQKMAQVQKAANKAFEALKNGEEPKPIQPAVVEEVSAETEANVEAMVEPKVKAAPKKKAAPKAKATPKSAPKGKKS